MPRPQKDRIVHRPPLFAEFKPIGTGRGFLEQITMTLDEYEALRLADYEALSQEEAADDMGVSRPTFTRLIEKARFKMADFLINGKVLAIEGGNVHFRNNIIHCQNCGHKFNINISTEINTCPQCGSTNLINLAGGFGHGRCCINSNQKGGRNVQRR